MRLVVLGGTQFIGRAVVQQLAGSEHEILIVHRGEHEPPELNRFTHLHVDRKDFSGSASEILTFKPDAAVDCNALSRDDARSALSTIPSDVRLLVVSSMDVYRAWGSVLNGIETDPVPLTEESPVRTDRFPYRDRGPEYLDYEKLHVEEEYLARNATVCRLPLVYGEHDYQLREEFVLRRVRAGRSRIPIGAGTWLWSRGYVREIARGIRLALESEAAGQVFNFCESRTTSMAMWVRHILTAAGSDAELVHVPEALVPSDCRLTRSVSQHMLFDPAKAKGMLGWVHTDPAECVRRSVDWHLTNPPEPDEAEGDFAEDDRALRAVVE